MSAPRIIRVGSGSGHDVATIAEAARLARDGDTVEVQAGDYRGDVTVWLQKELTIRSVGGPARLIADGAAAEGKGIWVIRNGDFTIQGFEFIGARVKDRNGSGVRFERGKLHVRDSKFLDNQMGLLTGNEPNTELTVERCEFTGPTDGGHWYHNLYVGQIAKLTVIASWSHRARVGHLLKTRARENHILYNRLTDEDGNASYELEFPNGGKARVVGNLIEQSPRSENEAIVSFGAEGYHWPENQLSMAFNTVVNEQADNAIFVRVKRGEVGALILDNLWVGPGALDLPSGTRVAGNLRVSSSVFRNPAAYDYRPAPSGLMQPATESVPQTLRPDSQYRHERDLESLRSGPLDPGAFQP